jgi:hypothetical protein
MTLLKKPGKTHAYGHDCRENSFIFSHFAIVYSETMRFSLSLSLSLSLS